MHSPSPPPSRPGTGARILIAMLVGVVLGAFLGDRVGVLATAGDLFIRLLMLAAIPLVVCNLLAGLTALTGLRTFGRLALKIAVWFAATTALAVLGAAVTMSALHPGTGMTLTAATVNRDVGAVPSIAEILIGLVPTNVFAAFADGNVLQLVVASILLGTATLMLPEEPRDRLCRLYADLALLFRRLVDLILIVAPLGIGALMAVAVGRNGPLLLGPMALFVAAVWGTQLMMVGAYVVALRMFTARRPFTFLAETWPVWATTIATTSSLASLSVALDVAEKIRLPRPIYSFTLPLGAQVNKDGTAIFLTAIALFTAQSAGMTLSAGELGSALLLAFLLSAGSGGIPGGGFVVSLILVRSLGLPLEVAAIAGGIYRLVDMGNTTLNVMGDLVGTVIVAESESRSAWT